MSAGESISMEVASSAPREAMIAGSICRSAATLVADELQFIESAELLVCATFAALALGARPLLLGHLKRERERDLEAATAAIRLRARVENGRPALAQSATRSRSSLLITWNGGRFHTRASVSRQNQSNAQHGLRARTQPRRT